MIPLKIQSIMLRTQGWTARLAYNPQLQVLRLILNGFVIQFIKYYAMFVGERSNLCDCPGKS